MPLEVTGDQTPTARRLADIIRSHHALEGSEAWPLAGMLTDLPAATLSTRA